MATSKEQLLEQVKQGDLAGAVQSMLEQMTQLQIVTRIVNDGEGEKTAASLPASQKISTRINILEGTIDTAVGSEFLSDGAYSVLADGHMHQVAAGCASVRDNIESLQTLIDLADQATWDAEEEEETEEALESLEPLEPLEPSGDALAVGGAALAASAAGATVAGLSLDDSPSESEAELGAIDEEAGLGDDADRVSGDLSDLDLGGNELDGLDLGDADLSDTDLGDTSLSDLDLSDPDLSDPDLSDALGSDELEGLDGDDLDIEGLGGDSLFGEADLEEAIAPETPDNMDDLLGEVAEQPGTASAEDGLADLDLGDLDLGTEDAGEMDLDGLDLGEAEEPSGESFGEALDDLDLGDMSDLSGMGNTDFGDLGLTNDLEIQPEVPVDSLSGNLSGNSSDDLSGNLFADPSATSVDDELMAGLLSQPMAEPDAEPNTEFIVSELEESTDFFEAPTTPAAEELSNVAGLEREEDELDDDPLAGLDLGDDLGNDLGDDLGDDLSDSLGGDLGNDLGDDLGDGSGDDFLGGGLGDDLGDDLGDGLGDDLGDDLGGGLDTDFGADFGTDFSAVQADDGPETSAAAAVENPFSEASDDSSDDPSDDPFASLGAEPVMDLGAESLELNNNGGGDSPDFSLDELHIEDAAEFGQDPDVDALALESIDDFDSNLWEEAGAEAAAEEGEAPQRVSRSLESLFAADEDSLDAPPRAEAQASAGETDPLSALFSDTSLQDLEELTPNGLGANGSDGSIEQNPFELDSLESDPFADLMVEED